MEIDFGLELSAFVVADVWGIADESVEAGCRSGLQEWLKGIAVEQGDTVGDFVFGGVAGCDFEGLCGDIRSGEVDAGTLSGEGDGDAARADADFEDLEGEIWGDGFKADVDEGFGFGSGDEDSGGDIKRAAVEFAVTDEVGDGFAFGAAGDEFAHGGALGFGEGSGEVGVEADTGAVAGVCEQKFGFEARRFDAFLAQEAGGPFEDALDGPVVGGGSIGRGGSGGGGGGGHGEAACEEPFGFGWRRR